MTLRPVLAGWIIALGTLSAFAQAPTSPDVAALRDEKGWRKAFHEIDTARAAIGACRERLPDYCEWEYRKSREESELEAVKTYMEARRRGEDVEDPLAGKVYVPGECQALFDAHPQKLAPRVEADGRDSCLSRFNALEAEIRRVEAFWDERRAALDREAQTAGIPRDWRDAGDD